MAYYAPPRDPTEVMGRRIFAFIIDAVIVGAVFVALFSVSGHRYTDSPTNACDVLRSRESVSFCVQSGSTVYELKSSEAAAVYGASAVVNILNAVVLQSITGASIGKLLLGLRVVGSSGQKAGFGRMLVRWLLLIVDLFCFGVVGLVTSLVTHPHRRVGDMAGGTYVIGTADVGRPIQASYAAAPAYAGAVPGGWAPPQQGQPQWGAPPQPQWGAPPPTPYQQQPGPYQQPAQYQQQPGQYQQPAPYQQQPGQYQQPPPYEQQPTPQWGAPPPPPAPQAPPPPPPPPAPAPPQEAPRTEPSPSTSGEAWWDKALRSNEDDDENQQ